MAGIFQACLTSRVASLCTRYGSVSPNVGRDGRSSSFGAELRTENNCIDKHALPWIPTKRI